MASSLSLSFSLSLSLSLSIYLSIYLSLSLSLYIYILYYIYIILYYIYMNYIYIILYILYILYIYIYYIYYIYIIYIYIFIYLFTFTDTSVFLVFSSPLLLKSNIVFSDVWGAQCPQEREPWVSCQVWPFPSVGCLKLRSMVWPGSELISSPEMGLLTIIVNYHIYMLCNNLVRDMNVHTYIYEKYSCSLFQYVYKPVRIDSFAFCCHNWSYDIPPFRNHPTHRVCGAGHQTWPLGNPIDSPNLTWNCMLFLRSPNMNLLYGLK